MHYFEFQSVHVARIRVSRLLAIGTRSASIQCIRLSNVYKTDALKEAILACKVLVSKDFRVEPPRMWCFSEGIPPMSPFSRQRLTLGTVTGS